MKYVYEYESCMAQYEKLLKRNFAKLKFLKHQDPSFSEFNEMEDVYTVIKKYLDAAQENIASLKAEYQDLNQHYLCLFEVEDNIIEELPNYLRRQEVLRLRFLAIIQESKRVNSCLDDILYGSPVETLERNSTQSPLERFHAAHYRLSKAVELESSSIVKTNISPPRFNRDDSYPQTRMDDNLGTSFSNKHAEELAITTQSPKSTQLCISPGSAIESLKSPSPNVSAKDYNATTGFVSSKPKEDSRLVVDLNSSRENICDICGRNFKLERYLKRHIEVVHEKLKPFCCTECDESFPRKDYMKRHILLKHAPNHSQPFVCNICDRSFNLKLHLGKHLLSHEDRKHLNCVLCDESFARKDDIKKHVLEKHSSNHPEHCECNICGEYSSRRNMNSHKKLVKSLHTRPAFASLSSSGNDARRKLKY